MAPPHEPAHRAGQTGGPFRDAKCLREVLHHDLHRVTKNTSALGATLTPCLPIGTMSREGSPSPAAFVAALVGVDSVQRTYAEVDAMAKRGQAGVLRELAIALEQRGHCAGVERWVLEAVFGRIARSLALHPSRDNARAAIELLSVERTHSTQRPWQPDKAARRVASLLAQGQAPAVCFELAPAVSIGPGAEVMACWIQELVVRGVAVSEVEPVARFWTGLGAAHPLAHLPLLLAPIEASMRDVLRRDAPSGSSHNPPWPIAGRHATRPSLVPAFQLERLPTPADLGAAAENWQEESNGRSDGGVFQLDERVGELRSGHIARLPLDCVANAGSIQTTRISAAIAASHLFAAAAVGGAYNQGRQAAYGRRDAWRSLAALVGVDVTRSLPEIERASHACQFYALTIASAWMHNVAWDLALACLREDGRTFAIVVATDTD